MSSLILRFSLFVLLVIIPYFSTAQNGEDWIEHEINSGYSCLLRNEADSAKFIFTQLNETLKDKDPDRLAAVNLSIGRVYHSFFMLDEALTYLNLASSHIDTTQEKQLNEDIITQKGVVYFDSGNLIKSMEEYTNALEIAYSIQDTFGLAILNNNIGLIYLETNDFDRAINYFENVVRYAKSSETQYLRAISLNNIGIAYYHLEEYNKSLKVLEIGESYAIASNREKELADILFNKGLNKVELHEFEIAQKFFENARKIYSDMEFHNRVVLCDVALYRTNHALKNFDVSKALEEKILATIDASIPLNVRIDFYEYLTENYAQEGDSAKAFIYAEQLIELGNELTDQLQSRTLVDLKTDVEIMKVSEKLSEIEAAHTKTRSEKAEIEAINAKLSRMNLKIIILSTLAGSLLIIIVILLFFSNKKKKRTNILLEEQKAQLHEQNNQILNSISYANSMEKLLLQQMNPHFIFNALTTAEASISVGDHEFAKNYLSMFASLLRQTLDYSRKNFVSLSEEIEFLKSYIELNSLKQGKDFCYDFEYDEDEIEDFVFTPPMLVQPFIENALIHGLYHKTNGKKELLIKVEPKENYILWTIMDNGVGREKSKEIKHTHKGTSHGIKITSDRIKWMKNIYGNHFSLEYQDLEEGTLVVLKTPIVEHDV